MSGKGERRMSLYVLQDALELGMIFSIMSLGVLLSFRILNIPDLTIDGSFTTGCAVSVLCAQAEHPCFGLLAAFLAGGAAGMVSAVLQTKGKVQPLLAGILTMTALYSVNLRIMSGQPNISIFGIGTIFTPFQVLFSRYGKLLLLGLLLLISALVLCWFLKTQIGMSLRACGDNEAMVKASSIDADKMKLLGLALANAFVALAGGIFAQYQGFADVSSGTGMMVVGLAGIIVGEAFFRKQTLLFSFLAVIFGAMLYRMILTMALQLGIEAKDLNLFSAALVALAISLPQLKKKRGGRHA